MTVYERLPLFMSSISQHAACSKGDHKQNRATVSGAEKRAPLPVGDCLQVVCSMGPDFLSNSGCKWNRGQGRQWMQAVHTIPATYCL